MKLRTSYFNRTVFFKDITRFFPVWVLYTIGLLLTLVLLDGVSSPTNYAQRARDLGDCINIFAVFNCGYAMLCAQLLFGDLYQSRLCNALHAMPLRRETWFVTHILSGLSFFVIPNLLFALLTLTFLGNAYFVAGYFLLGVTLPFLFFFGVAVFSVMCVGNRFAMALVYGIINLLALLVAWIIQSLYQPLLYGITLDLDFLWHFSPLAEVVGTTYFPLCRTDGPGIFLFEADGFGYLGIYAGVGVLFGGLALALYRRRHLECAGDFIVVKPLAPIFLILYTLCAGTLLHLFFQLFLGTQMNFFYIGLLIGYFTGQMLLRRTPNVFKKKVFLGAGVFALAMLLSFGITRLDPLGITRYIPASDQIESVEVCDFAGYYQKRPYTVTDPKEIDELSAVHAAAIAEGRAEEGRLDYFTLVYRLKNGMTVKRSYTIAADGQTAERLVPIFSRPKAVLYADLDSAEAYADKMQLLYLDIRDTQQKLSGAPLVAFLDALLLDCEEGSMVQAWGFHASTTPTIYLSFVYGLPEHPEDVITEDTHTHTVTIYGDNTHAYRWLKENGYLLGDMP